MKAARANPERIGPVLSVLRKAYGEPADGGPSDPLGRLVLATLLEGTTESRARAAYRRLTDWFVDWNEVRVTPAEELAEVMGNLPAGRDKAVSLGAFLNEIFEKHNVLSLDFLKEKPKREARTLLESLPGVQPSAAAAVFLQSLGGHAIPVDAGVHRLLVRLGVADPASPVSQIQSVLERKIAAKDSPLLVRLLRRHADDVCLAGEPKCKACPLAAKCPSKGIKARVALPPLEKPIPVEPVIFNWNGISDASLLPPPDVPPARIDPATSLPARTSRPGVSGALPLPSSLPVAPGSGAAVGAADKSAPEKGADKTRPAKPADKTAASKPADKSGASKSAGAKPAGGNSKHDRGTATDGDSKAAPKPGTMASPKPGAADPARSRAADPARSRAASGKAKPGKAAAEGPKRDRGSAPDGDAKSAAKPKSGKAKPDGKSDHKTDKPKTGKLGAGRPALRKSPHKPPARKTATPKSGLRKTGSRTPKTRKTAPAKPPRKSAGKRAPIKPSAKSTSPRRVAGRATRSGRPAKPPHRPSRPSSGRPARGRRGRGR